VNAPRLLQLLGLLIVSFVMIYSYVVSDMIFQFGGLGVGAAVFLIGQGMQSRDKSS
jgi:hypothetical protein